MKIDHLIEFINDLRKRIVEMDSTANLRTFDKCVQDGLNAHRRKVKIPLEQTFDFQQAVLKFTLECFGFQHTYDKLARADRYVEEVYELLQSVDYPPERLKALQDYVWSRPKGDPIQEAGGVALTFNAFNTAHQIPTYGAAMYELQRCWGNIDLIREKQAAKENDSALPGK